MTVDLIIAALIIAAIAAVWWVVTHHKAPVAVSPKAIVDTVSAGITDSWAQVKADLPAMISSELAQLKADKAALTDALTAANAKIEADKKLHDAALASVAARVSAAVTASPELPIPPTVAVAAAAPDFPAALGVP